MPTMFPGMDVEIDLLRDGLRTANLAGVPETEYLVYISRGGMPREGVAWPITLRQKLPVIGIPLRSPDPDAPLDLQEALRKAIERGSYDLDLDYEKEAVPPLRGETKIWAESMTRAHKED